MGCCNIDCGTITVGIYSIVLGTLDLLLLLVIGYGLKSPAILGYVVVCLTLIAGFTLIIGIIKDYKLQVSLALLIYVIIGILDLVNIGLLMYGLNYLAFDKESTNKDKVWCLFGGSVVHFTITVCCIYTVIKYRTQRFIKARSKPVLP